MEKYKKILLIVEDDVVLSKNLASFFNDSGFSVLQAENGVEGLETAVKEKPDAILLDILMPKMSGLTVLKKLRQEHPGLKMPVILLTNLEANDDVLKAITANEPTYYLIKKDWKLADILEVVKNSLATKHS